LAASQVGGNAVKLNRMIERERRVDVGLVQKIMQHKVRLLGRKLLHCF
jgi:hypothetical protein